MDGRNLSYFLCGLLTLACGCTNQGGLLRWGKSGDADEHKAATYEAYANLGAAAGFAPQQTPQQQAQFREEAKLAYQKAIEVDPKYLPAYLGLARLETRCEDHQGALATYDRALKLAPRDAGIWHERGLVLCRQKNWQEAVTSLQKACELSPGNRQFLTTLGYTLGRAGRLPESLATLAQAEGEAKAHYDLARLLRHMNQPALAKEHVALALSKDPNLAEAGQLLAELEGRAQPAIQRTDYQEAVPAPPSPAIVNAAMTAPAGAAEAIMPGPKADSPEAAAKESPAGATREGQTILLPPRPVVRPGQRP
jgi:tetratricopeptide (TPR) repeat protein